MLNPPEELKIEPQSFWDKRYLTKNTGWDLGLVSPPIKRFIDTLSDKFLRILIPGCGNAYEAECLLQQGFTNITLIDIAPTLVAQLQEKFARNKCIKIILGDFFQHSGTYDLIIEQTFFCALNPALREAYTQKMYDLLALEGRLVGLLFNRFFEQNGPPFGGDKAEYFRLFSAYFSVLEMHVASDSILPRANTELWFELKKCN